MAGLKLLVCAMATLLCASEAARILGIFPLPAKSHMIVMRALMQGLANRGHQVTMVTAFPADKPHPNITEIVIKGVKFNVDPSMIFNMEFGPWTAPLVLSSFTTATTDECLSQPQLQKLIQSKNEHFDLVVTEAFFNEADVAFAHKFKAPHIQVCPFTGMYWMFEWVGSPTNPSYITESVFPMDSRMTFLERVANTVMRLYWMATNEFLYLPKQEQIMRKHFKDHVDDLPSLKELLRSTSLIFFNTHFSLSAPRPLTPNAVQVGGMHVRAPKKLPQDLQKYLDDAKDGAIFFSWGSTIRSVDMPEATRKEILVAFSQLKQRILWKWEDDVLPGQPNNVKLGKWLPQNDILAHPNVQLFISHGGGLSTQEAIVRGVPVVGIPFIHEQTTNMMTVVRSGLGIKLDFKNITSKSLLWAINEVLQPKYRANAQKLSQLFKDQPMHPLDTAVYWTEYVIRHKGAPHMRSAALDLYWFQYLLLDVIAFLAVVGMSILLAMYMIIRKIYRLCCSRKPESKKKKQ